jgi:hypothetical protein
MHKLHLVDTMIVIGFIKAGKTASRGVGGWGVSAFLVTFFTAVCLHLSNYGADIPVEHSFPLV